MSTNTPTLQLSEYGKKEIGRRLIMGQKTIQRGPHSIPLQPLLDGSQKHLAQLKHPSPAQDRFVEPAPVQPKKKATPRKKSSTPSSKSSTQSG